MLREENDLTYLPPSNGLSFECILSFKFCGFMVIDAQNIYTMRNTENEICLHNLEMLQLSPKDIRFSL